ncbi:MAG: hypothetical protein IKG52_14545 [Rhodobacteraceae bacterium]|nr:hypothetical protein [Paracoccaceae bacterium]
MTDIRSMVPIGDGRIVLSGWPGLRITPTGKAWIDPEATAATLAEMQTHNVAVLIALCETAELRDHAIPQLRHCARQAAIRLVHAPICDFQPPDERFLRLWHAFAPILYQRIDAGAAIALVCSYGAGRSGTIAAMMLAEYGLPMPEAVAQIRAGFPVAIESSAQERWLSERCSRDNAIGHQR